MLSLIPLSFAAGVLTVAAPCILPVLPVILGGSVGGSKWKPLGIALGLVAAFTIFGTAFILFLDFFGISKPTVRIVSVVLLFVFGLALAMPAWYERVVAWVGEGWRKLHNPSQRSLIVRERETQSGFWSAFGIGASLGVIWTPCAGPILGAMLTLAATTRNIFQSGMLMLVYALGAALPMLLIGYGSRALVLRIKKATRALGTIERIGGVVLMLWAIAIVFGVDRIIQAVIVPFAQKLPL